MAFPLDDFDDPLGEFLLWDFQQREELTVKRKTSGDGKTSPPPASQQILEESCLANSSYRDVYGCDDQTIKELAPECAEGLRPSPGNYTDNPRSPLNPQIQPHKDPADKRGGQSPADVGATGGCILSIRSQVEGTALPLPPVRGLVSNHYRRTSPTSSGAATSGILSLSQLLSSARRWTNHHATITLCATHLSISYRHGDNLTATDHWDSRMHIYARSPIDHHSPLAANDFVQIAVRVLIRFSLLVHDHVEAARVGRRPHLPGGRDLTYGAFDRAKVALPNVGITVLRKVKAWMDGRPLEVKVPIAPELKRHGSSNDESAVQLSNVPDELKNELIQLSNAAHLLGCDSLQRVAMHVLCTLVSARPSDWSRDTMRLAWVEDGCPAVPVLKGRLGWAPGGARDSWKLTEDQEEIKILCANELCAERWQDGTVVVELAE